MSGLLSFAPRAAITPLPRRREWVALLLVLLVLQGRTPATAMEERPSNVSSLTLAHPSAHGRGTVPEPSIPPPFRQPSAPCPKSEPGLIQMLPEGICPDREERTLLLAEELQAEETRDPADSSLDPDGDRWAGSRRRGRRGNRDEAGAAMLTRVFKSVPILGAAPVRSTRRGLGLKLGDWNGLGFAFEVPRRGRSKPRASGVPTVPVLSVSYDF